MRYFFEFAPVACLHRISFYYDSVPGLIVGYPRATPSVLDSEVLAGFSLLCLVCKQQVTVLDTKFW